MRRDLTRRELAVVTPLIVLILLLGFYPKPVIDVINPAVKATLTQIGTSDPAPTTATGGGKWSEVARGSNLDMLRSAPFTIAARNNTRRTWIRTFTPIWRRPILVTFLGCTSAGAGVSVSVSTSAGMV